MLTNVAHEPCAQRHNEFVKTIYDMIRKNSLGCIFLGDCFKDIREKLLGE